MISEFSQIPPKLASFQSQISLSQKRESGSTQLNVSLTDCRQGAESDIQAADAVNVGHLCE